MPKEIINYDRDDAEALNAEFSLHWSAGPNGVVQLCAEFTIDVLKEHLALMAENRSPDKRSQVYSIPLTRDDMQRMIRTGKRARDAVFGADE